jgi:hypothetical protein
MTKWQPSSRQLDVATDNTIDLRTSTKPHWEDARRRLAQAGVQADGAVLAAWHSGGPHAGAGIIATEDRRVFSMRVRFDYDRDGRPVARGQGWITRWDEIPAEEITPTSQGYPNSWMQAVMVAEEVFKRERRPTAG